MCTTIVFIWVLVVAFAGCYLFIYLLWSWPWDLKNVSELCSDKGTKVCKSEISLWTQTFVTSKTKCKVSLQLYILINYCVISFCFHLSQWLLKKSRIKMYLCLSFHSEINRKMKNFKEKASNYNFFFLVKHASIIFTSKFFYYSVVCFSFLYLCSPGGLFWRKQIFSLQALGFPSLASRTNSSCCLYCLLGGMKGSASPLLTSFTLLGLLSFRFRTEVFGSQL